MMRKQEGMLMLIKVRLNVSFVRLPILALYHKECNTTSIVNLCWLYLFTNDFQFFLIISIVSLCNFER